MKKFFISLFLFSTVQSQILNDLHSPENIKKFADYLFSERDYLRSVLEYEKLSDDDTIQFKVAVALREMEDYNNALKKLSEIKNSSVFYVKAQQEYYKTLFLSEDYQKVRESLLNTNETEFQRLLYLSYLFTSSELPDKKEFLNIFPSDEKKNILSFYNNKTAPPYKSTLLAGIMSAVFPGSGKIYLGEIGDGITAFIASSVFAFLSYDNFSHNHNLRGWLFAGLGTFFYAGNIYGSVSAAKIYNAKVDYEYNSNLKDYLKSKNYFLPENDLIK